MKKKTLMTRVLIIIGVLMVTNIVNIIMMLFLVSRTAIPAALVRMVVLMDILMNIFMGVLIAKYLIDPYYKIRKIGERFVSNEIYEELFEMEYEWIPGWDQVMKKIARLVDKQDAIKMSKKQAEYLALQNQINPHFLYNTLDAIRGDAICAGLNSVAETAEALSMFFRYSITGVDKLVTMEEELENVENYFTIQYNRFGDKLKLEIDCADAAEIMQYRIPKLTIQPFVENAIFHGLEKRIQGGKVKIKVDSTVNKLLITISDDGVGMSEEQVEKINSYFDKIAISYVGEDKKRRGGIAMKNVNSRIKLLFGEDYGVHIYSIEQMGTDVMITLPKLRKGDYEEGTIAG